MYYIPIIYSMFTKFDKSEILFLLKYKNHRIYVLP